MKKTSRMFMGVAVAALLLISCNDTGLNASGGDDNNIAAKGGGKEGEKQPYYSPPYDPTVVIIADDVKQWMEEQLASKGNEKRRFSISDMYPTGRIPSDAELGLSVTSDSNENQKYFLNGKEISFKEYIGMADDGKRKLSIPGVIWKDSQSWTVLITAEEIAELLKKYDGLSISFVPEYREDV